LLATADATPEVSVVLLEGAGRGFSSGVDLAALDTELDALTEGFDELLEALICFSKPLVAAVHGVAVGFGATILLHCDIVVVADTARLRFPFTALGTAPEAASSALLPRIVGMQRSADLLLTSRWITGEEAADMGLASRVFPEDALHSEARAISHTLAGLPSPALVAAKRLMKAGAGDIIRNALDREREAAGDLRGALGPIGARHADP
jgi:enoyl-CoA hydratase/carnithine racemase